MYEMGEQLERVILAGVQTYESDDTVQSLYELRELAETAGAVTVGTIMQSRETIHPATYLGKGKLEELKELLYDLDATGGRSFGLGLRTQASEKKGNPR